MNRVPVKRVVYRALEVLEKRFDLEVLRVLFSEENMKAYPDLEFFARSFENGNWVWHHPLRSQSFLPILNNHILSIYHVSRIAQ